jgi:hypothetical protein
MSEVPITGKFPVVDLTPGRFPVDGPTIGVPSEGVLTNVLVSDFFSQEERGDVLTLGEGS